VPSLGRRLPTTPWRSVEDAAMGAGFEAAKVGCDCGRAARAASKRGRQPGFTRIAAA
jgi:hypothetical protein